MEIIGLIEAFESTKDRINITYEQFKEDTKDFEITPVYYKNEVIGAMLVKENHVHACIKPQYKGKWFGRVALRVISKIIEEYGEAITSATTEDGRKIVESLGFIKDGDVYRSTKKWALKQY